MLLWGLSKNSIFLVKVEGFYNTFSDLLVQNPNPRSNDSFLNSIDSIAYGVELFVRLDREKRKNVFYGWASYTFSSSQSRTNLPDAIGGEYLSNSFEQPHSLKLILGYTWGKHDIGTRFTLSSGFPYTPIVGSTRNNIPGIERYSPVEGTRFSERFPLNHRLDIRYTYTSVFDWGSIDWFIEVINLYYAQPIASQSWNYNRPFASEGENQNPTFVEDFASIIIPNFGIEIKF